MYSLLYNRKIKAKKGDLEKVPMWLVGTGRKNFFISKLKDMELLKKRTRVIKTHNTDLNQISSLLEPIYGQNIFFVRSDRCYIDPDCTGGKNILCIKFEDMIYKTPEERYEVIARVASLVRVRFQSLLSKVPNVDMANRRLAEMDETLKRLTNFGDTSRGVFSKTIDHKYGIHANHKGQSKTW
eukprot:CAMPEP_0113315452 /NCGR_PEP_ID=MMETSP0010_2-20120614/11115_1 /TAXON_ID=216773 ORGANISM="Corethron hystrix, Strain 308" /NCGR_SAMPLE_ID=MMETSP0010_2 /ASSEMBLY_ACC=CAM_ASM_000155 /LENGTH=182 /DNA_ID=CAMNT_0000171957 /DNA_START=217 /DNA_END=762 /DNA_ORIENTATION=+ /assembly_acc=CAM_ASM_000155